MTDKVVLGYPYAGTHLISQPFMSSVMKMFNYEILRGKDQQLIDIIPQQGCYIHLNRNSIVRDFLANTKGDWLLFVDTDIEIAPESCKVMTAMANQVKADILAMPCPLLNHKFNFYKEASSIGTYETVTGMEGDSIYELDAAGTGCMIIHRRVLKKLEKLHPEPSCWFGHDQIGFNELGDDFTFCRRAQKAGFKLVGYTGWICNHWKFQKIDMGEVETRPMVDPNEPIEGEEKIAEPLVVIP